MGRGICANAGDATGRFGPVIDCILLGATLPGMTLGAMLARAGWKVLLLERKRVAGGRAAPWKREGYLSLPGIPRVRYGEKGPFMRICRQLDLEPLLVPLNQAWVLDTDQKVHRITIGRPGVLRADFFSPWDRVFAWRLLRSLKGEALEEMEEENLEEWFVRNGIRGSLQKYLKVLAYETTHCTALEKISAGEVLRCFQKAFFLRSYLAYPRDGWIPILERLEQEIEREGEIRWQTKVERIEIEEGRVVGVRVGAEILKTRHVVCATPCQQLVHLLPEGTTTPSFVDLCKKAVPSAALIVDLALKHRIFPKQGLWFFLDPPSYGTFLSNLCHRHAPAGKQLATFVCPCSPEEVRQPDLVMEMEKKIEENLRKAIPRSELAVEWKRSHVVRMLDSIAIQADQTRKDRPGYRVPNVKGLFLVGDSTCAPGACMEMEYESVLACYERMVTERDA
jgi:phytoene dehydrogenase-like protein